MSLENLLEQVGILKHKLSVEEVDAGEKKSRQLTADYLESKIDLTTYTAELDKFPKLDLRQLAQKLHFKS